jgi:hypothetical protein
MLVAASLLGGACRRGTDAGDVELSWRLSARVVGPATLTLTLTEKSGAPLDGAAVRVEGHMTHAGMAPVLANVTSRGRGVYDAALEFTMQGDWALIVTAHLPDGRRLERRLDVANVRPAA